MNPIQIVLIFLAVLFVYLQIQFHYKVEDGEVYESSVELPKKKFEKVCDSERIPFVFYFYESPDIIDFINTQNYSSPLCNKTLVNVRKMGANKAGTVTGTVTANNRLHKFRPMTFLNGMEYMSGSGQESYVSERNGGFLKTIQATQFIRKRDQYLRPAMCQYADYDMLMGSLEAHTPLRYEINQRTFFLVTSGTVCIRLIHPTAASASFRPSEEPVIDNDLMEYTSSANIWNDRVAARIPCVHIKMPAGKCIFVPPFWWYSLQFSKSNTRIIRFSYRNFINTMVLSPYFLSHKFGAIERNFDEFFMSGSGGGSVNSQNLADINAQKNKKIIASGTIQSPNKKKKRTSSDNTPPPPKKVTFDSPVAAPTFRGSAASEPVAMGATAASSEPPHDMNMDMEMEMQLEPPMLDENVQDMGMETTTTINKSQPNLFELTGSIGATPETSTDMADVTDMTDMTNID